VAIGFAGKLRGREQVIGYWVASDNPPMTERLARLGYDYICLDLQHGMIDYHGCLRALTAIDAGPAAGVVRVPGNDPVWIGRALDAGAQAVVVPLVDSADEAAAAVRACRYQPHGRRSYGPVRSELRIGPTPADANDAVACIVMIETRQGLDDVAAICAVPGVDAVYVGPSDLALALGADRPQDGPALPEFEEALRTISASAEAAGIAAGLHCHDGAAAARALSSGFTFVSISNDISHLSAAAAGHLSRARQQKF
jgi:4-hydroxy-2-oxoheptanedioate aldolase